MTAQATHSNVRLKYKIVKCTSEDPEYPVAELLSHSQHTRGWQTARFCEFPQEVWLQFDGPVHLRQVQFLSHQSKIATKIELFTGNAPPGSGAQLDAIQFKRLGYLSLDNNERSQFQARELKSVYVDVPAQFLRILLHKCHANRYNVANQVGLIALSCLGDNLSPDNQALAQAVIPPKTTASFSTPAAQVTLHANVSTPSASANSAPNSQGATSSSAGALPSGEGSTQGATKHATSAHVPSRPVSSVSNSSSSTARPATPSVSGKTQLPHDLADVDETKYDARIMERMRDLAAKKQECVAAEDYGGAKRCKEGIVTLKQTGLRISDLENQKRQAVEDEEYDVAKSLKAEIDRLRLECEHAGTEEAEKPLAPLAQKAEVFPQRRQPQQQSLRVHQPPPVSTVDETPVSSPGSSPSAVRQQQRLTPPSVPRAAPRSAQGGGYGQGSYGPPKEVKRANLEDMPPTPSLGSTAVPTSSSSVSERSIGDRATPQVGNGAAQGRQAVRAPAVQPEKRHKEVMQFSSLETANQPLAGVPNVEELGQPEPLAAAFEKEAEPLRALFGEYIVQCLFSKTWSLRDAALQKLALQLRSGEALSRCQDVDALMSAYSTVLVRTVPDKNVQVFHSSAALLQAVCQELLGGLGSRGPRHAQAALEPIVPLLAERLGDTNARAEKTARDAHLDMARCGGVGAAFAAQCLLRPPKKKTVPPRVYSSRLQLLAVLVAEFGLQPNNTGGLALEPVAQLAMDWFGNPSAEVRECVVKLIAACYARVGLGGIERYLANLRQAQREVFDAEFHRVSFGVEKAPRSMPTTPSAAPAAAGYSNYGAPGRPLQVETEAVDDQVAEDEDDDLCDDFTCQFCGRKDMSFTADALDIHYWRECPALTACQLCEQVIEISRLHTHFVEECEFGEAAEDLALNLRPWQCSLCRVGLAPEGHVPEEQEWHEHLLLRGCLANPRGQAVFRR
eukprot:TRINITY_DN58276_c0_g1_i1.p1 TRINITY_DN58276_c0_g1~~TRINITY_DN58276_c0_g1_i1.p1  ORF type:complete len:960 (+),score=171.92 TRINITY_DN58276_c0_g1_i1:142-3021(+)